jgi:phosphonoacetaldehyde hydrolase
MCFENAVRLGVSDVRAVVKVDDTLPGIAEGRTAGMWTVGLAVSGNEVGLPRDEWLELPAGERRRLRAGAYERMRAAGADYVVDDISGVWPCVKAIATLLAGDAHAA